MCKGQSFGLDRLQQIEHQFIWIYNRVTRYSGDFYWINFPSFRAFFAPNKTKSSKIQ